MNPIKKLYARSFQLAMRTALPLLPYKDPKIIDKITDICAVLTANGKKKPMIVTDKNIDGLPISKNLYRSLTDDGFPIVKYDGVLPNPTTEQVDCALDIYRKNQCDSIVAVGGGSALDCAKALGILIVRPNKTLSQMKGILKVRKRLPLLIAIPTTAGTGSETTLAAVITDAKTRHKYAINDFPLIPKYAVLDPSATQTLPKHVISTTGIDALTHAIEAFVGRSTTKQTRADALAAIDLIFKNLKNAYESGDEESRKNMLLASHLAGRAFSKSYVGYVHALAHALGGKYNTPHGLANSVLLLPVLYRYGGKIYKKLKIIALYCGFCEKDTTPQLASEILLNKIEELENDLNIPRNLPEIKEKDLDELINNAYKEAYPLYPVPQLWDKSQLKQIYYKVMKN